MEYARAQFSGNRKSAIIDSVAALKIIIDDAEGRIEEEGIVVRDMKGSVIAHPAIKIAQDAMKIMLDIINKSY